MSVREEVQPFDDTSSAIPKISPRQLADALTCLLEARSYDTAKLPDAARESLAIAYEVGDWGAAFEEAAEKLNGAMRSFKATPADFLAHHRLVLPAATVSSRGEVIVLKSVSRSRINALALGSNEAQELRLSAKELAARLDETADAKRTWYTAEPLRPLDSAGIVQPPAGYGTKAQKARKRAWSVLGRSWSELVPALVYAIAVSLLTVGPPIAAQVVINTVAFGSMLQPLVVVVTILIGVLAIASMLKMLQVVAVELLAQRVFLRVSADFAGRLPRLDPAGLGVKEPRELANRFFDVVAIDKALGVLMFDTVAAVLQIGTGTILFSLYHPYLAIFAACLLIALALVLFVLGSGAVATSLQESTAKYELAEWFERLAEHRRMFGSRSGLAFARDETDLLARKWLSSRQRHFSIVLRQYGGMLALQTIGSGLLLLVGGYLVIAEQLTLGQLVAAELVMATTVGSMARLGKDLPKLYDLTTSLEKLGQITDLPLERDGGEPLAPNGPGLRVEVRDLVYGTPQNPKSYTLHELVVESGMRLAIDGPSLSARSTLLRHINGELTPASGSITLDGRDILDLSLPSVRESVVLLRDVELIPGTIEDNVRAGRDDIGAVKVREVLTLVGLADTVQKLPKRASTPLDPLGGPLSRDQAMLLVVARALACKPRLILVDGLLDGASDPVIERAVQVLTDTSRSFTLILSSSDPRISGRLQKRTSLTDSPTSISYMPRSYSERKS